MVETIVPRVLRSEKFSLFSQVRFGFSCRDGLGQSPFGFNMSFRVGDREESVQRNRETFFGTLGIPIDRLAFAKQCHSTTAVAVDEPGTYEGCDALISNRREVFLTITAADCLPAFVFDSEKRVISAIHAGWRGSAGRIVEKTINKMVTEFNSEPKDLAVFVGPSARLCCYEVGSDVAREFPPTCVTERNGRLFLDLKEANVAQLLDSGVPKENIDVSPYCTICTSEMFHSYRRDKERSGRMMGVIGIV